MPVFNNILAGASGATGAAAFQIDRSLRFNSGDSAYLNKTPSSAGNRKTWTWSGWVKRCALPSNHTALFTAGTTVSDSGFFRITMHANGHINVATGSTNILYSGGKLRDFSAWYHVLVSVDTTASSNQVKCYLNGVLYDQATAIANVETAVNSTVEHQIGRDTSEGTHADIYLAEVHFIDGQALAPTDFGEFDATTGVWNPIEYTGTYGTNGFHLDFSDNSSNAALGYDAAGSNDWTVNNLTALNPGITTSAITNVGTSGSNTLLTFSDSTNFSQIQTGDVAKEVESTVNTGTIGISASAGETSNLNTVFQSGTTNDTYFESGSTSSPNKLNITTTVTLYPGQVFTAKIGMDNGTGNGSTVSGAVGNVRIGGTDYQMTGSIKGNGTSNPCSYTGTLSFTVPDGGGGDWTQFFVTGLSSNDRTLICEFAIDGVKLLNNQDIPSFTSYEVISVDATNSQLVVDPGATWSVGEILRVNAFGIEEGDNLIDTPTNYTSASGNNGGNYCVMNLLDKKSNVATQNGNMEVSNSSDGWSGIRGTIGVSSGKWYYELETETASIFAGIATAGVDINANAPQDTTSVLDDGALIYCDDGKYLLDQGGSANRQTYGSALANGDILGVAVDLDGNTVQFYKNGSALGSIDISSSPLASNTIFPYFVSYYSSNTTYFNFGQRPFAFPQTGYKSLCTTNLPDPTIADGSTAFDAVTYTGNGGTQSITGLGFNPDFVWAKARNNPPTGIYHTLLDAVRGTSSGYYKAIFSNSSDSEDNPGNVSHPGNVHGGITSFNSDGFTLSAGTTDEFLNENTYPYVAWAWDAGTSTVSNTDGSITSNVRANASAGFSIVSYTGSGSNATVGHGLNAAPEWVLVKNRGATQSWQTFHVGIGNTKSMHLNTSDITDTASSYWQNTDPTSSVFSIGTSSSVNQSSTDFIAYCFAPVEGYSAFGSYTGNGSADGPFVYTGFRPAFILLKRTDAAFNWILSDTARDPDNEAENLLRPNLSSAEVSQYLDQDILSNGFKHRGTDGASNASGGTYIYAAFAEHPFKTARAR